MKKNFITSLMLAMLFVFGLGTVLEAADVRVNSDARLNSLDLATDSTITSQNKFSKLQFGGQSWGQPQGRMLTIHENTTLTCDAHSGKILVFGVGAASAITITLPEAEQDCEFTFIWDNDNTNVLDTTATDTISCGDSETAAGATVTATDKGDMMKIVGVTTNEWYCTNVSLISDFTFN